jgi:bifunctional DNase/RNase
MKREVKIIALSYSQSQSHAYVAVLSEVNGHRKLPIIIKTQDAQTIALKIEDMKSPRPLTHDIFKTLADGYGIDCQEAIIYKVLEGVFYSKIVTNNGVDDVEIELSAGDAISLSLTFNCSLYVTEEVLASCGVQMDDAGQVVPDSDVSVKKSKKDIISVDDLKKMMNEAIENEEYELAAELRDRISKIESE